MMRRTRTRHNKRRWLTADRCGSFGSRRAGGAGANPPGRPFPPERHFSLPQANGREKITARNRELLYINSLRHFWPSRQGSFFPCRGVRQGSGRELSCDINMFHSIIDNLAKSAYVGAAVRRRKPAEDEDEYRVGAACASWRGNRKPRGVRFSASALRRIMGPPASIAAPRRRRQGGGKESLDGTIRLPS
jgi:hypothetical protein